MLTPKQESFCLAYIETGNASEAYRRSYDCKKMKPESINRKAKELFDNGKIAARVEELRAPVRQRAQITLEQHLTDLQRLRDLAEGEGKYSAAVAAEVSRGKASGLYVEKVEHTGKDGASIKMIVSDMPAEEAANIYKRLISR
jgi:phage terminase small subunit